MPGYRMNANNNLGSSHVFHRRLLYRFFALSFGSSVPSTLAGVKDYWTFENHFYGKVSPNFVSVEPDIQRMVQIEGQSGRVLVLDFVAESFERFKSFFKTPLKYGMIEQGTPVSDPTPVRGYQSPLNQYNDHVMKFIRDFNAYLMKSQKYYKIKGVKDYTKEFFKFYFTKNFILNKSSYYMSSNVNSLSSGLSIEIADLDPSDDQQKIDFINSSNFWFYRQAAINAGFLIDKNIPWRLNIDLKSPVTIKKYGSAYIDGISLVDDVFLTYFRSTHFGDIDNLKSLIVLGYNEFYEKIPPFGPQALAPRLDGSSSAPANCAIPLEKTSIEKLNQTFSFFYWSNNYVDIKNREMGAPYNKQDLERIKRNSRQAGVGEGSTINYINEKFKLPWLYEGSLVYEKLKQEFRESGDFSLDNFSEYVIMIVKSSIDSIY